VLGEPSAPTRPCKGAFDHPAPCDDKKAGCPVRAAHNLDCPIRFEVEQGKVEFVTSETAIGKDRGDCGEAVQRVGDHNGCAVAVLIVRA
jgi:hypothetical protein